MPEPEVSPAVSPEPSPARRSWKKLSLLAVVLIIVRSAAGIFLWLRARPSTSSEETSTVHPTLALETFVLVPKTLALGEVQKVLQQLLREQAWIRDLSTILETPLDASAASKHPVLPRRSRRPEATDCSPPSSAAFSMDCTSLPESKSRKPFPSCCARPRRSIHGMRLLERFLPKIAVLSPLEIPPMVPVQSLGTVG